MTWNKCEIRERFKGLSFSLNALGFVNTTIISYCCGELYGMELANVYEVSGLHGPCNSFCTSVPRDVFIGHIQDVVKSLILSCR